MSQARAAILGAGAGAAATLLLLRLWSTSADESWDDVSVDSDGESEDEADASQQPPAVVRDDYSSTDAPYKMLLIFNMELYKLSSKTGEMKTVKMSPGKAAAQSGHLPLPPPPLPPPPPPSTRFLPRLGTPPSARTGARCGSAPTRCATGCGSVQITAPRVAAREAEPNRPRWGCRPDEDHGQVSDRRRAAGAGEALHRCRAQLLPHPRRWAQRTVSAWRAWSASLLTLRAVNRHTEIEPGSRTVLAVGPAPASALDPITRHLKPY